MTTGAVAIPWQRERRVAHLLSVIGKFCRSKPLGAAGAAVTLLMVLVAIFAPLIAPYDPLGQNSVNRLLPPGGQYLLGTDHLGRDIFSRLVFGSRISIWVGMITVGLGTTSGSLIGLVSGYFGGRVDLFLQRLMDSIMAIPMLVLAMAMVAMLGSATTNVMIAIAIVLTPSVSRIVRGAVLSVKENQYVEAARAIGCSAPRIIRLHILPNVFAPILVVGTVSLGSAILTEASLSFLGLGTPDPLPSWGGMLSGEGRRFFRHAPWIAIYPGMAITVVVLGFNLLGDALRDVLDPRLRGSGQQ